MRLRFKYGKTTTRTHMFSEVEEDGSDSVSLGNHMVGQLYVQKAFFDGKKTKPEDAIVVVDLSIEDEDGD